MLLLQGNALLGGSQQSFTVLEIENPSRFTSTGAWQKEFNRASAIGLPTILERYFP
jgi:hypothetical protein